MKRFRPKAWQSILVLAALSPVLLDGCVSIGVSRSNAPGTEAATGSLEVTVVEKSHDAQPTSSQVVTRLVRLESGIEQPVAEFSDSTWTKNDLPPGQYRLRVSHWIDKTGKTHTFSGSDEKTFRIRNGEHVQARVVLRKFPTGAVVAISVVVVVGIAVAVVASAFKGGFWKSLSNTDRECDRERRERSRGPIPFLK
jgi:hypothetical protein